MKKLNDDTFDRTRFNVRLSAHSQLEGSVQPLTLLWSPTQIREKKVSDKNFNQVEELDKDKLSVVDFSKDGDDDDIRVSAVRH